MRAWFLGACALVAATSGCGSSGDAGDGHDFRTPRPAAIDIGAAAAVLDAPHDRVFIVDAPTGAPQARVVPIGQSAVTAVPRNGGTGLLVLTHGNAGTAGKPEAPALWVIPTNAAEPVRTIPLGSRFSGVSQSDDGRWVILSFTENRQAGDVLWNPNELAIIDLQAPQPVVVTRTIRSLGSVPRAITFSPRMMVGEAPRTLAVITSDSYVTLLDLDNLNAMPPRPEITVPLTVESDTRKLVAAEVLFDTASPAVYVRVPGVTDVYGLALAAIPPENRTTPNDFRPSVSFLAAGEDPRDIEIFDAGEGPRVLVVDARSRLHVIEPRSSRSTAIDLGHDASRVLVYDGPAPGDPTPSKRAVVFGATRVTFVDLVKLEEFKTRNLDVRELPGGVAEIRPMLNDGIVLIRHNPNTAGAGLSVIRLGNRTVSPIFTRGNLDLSDAASGRVWVLANDARIGFLTLGTLATGEVLLDAPVAQLIGTGGRVLLFHHGLEGYVTTLDAANPSRATAQSLRGFLAQDLIAETRKEAP